VACGVEVCREPARRFTEAQLHRCSTLDHARRDQLADNDVRYCSLDTAKRCTSLARGIVDARLERSQVPWRFPGHEGESVRSERRSSAS
jgi:hypothetical protein